jgi:hypothetical protein
VRAAPSGRHRAELRNQLADELQPSSATAAAIKREAATKAVLDELQAKRRDVSEGGHLRGRKVGDEKPSQGDELSNERLAVALETSTEFTRTEWEAFGITGLRTDHFIKSKSGASYFQPADNLEEWLRSVEEHDHAVEFKQKEWEVTCWDRTSPSSTPRACSRPTSPLTSPGP